MKVTVINLANPVIKIYNTGLQGPRGPSSGVVISETTISLTITDQNYLVLKGNSAMEITLKNPAVAEPVTIMNQGSMPATIIGPILGDTSLIIVPGNVYQFVPSGGQYYVA